MDFRGDGHDGLVDERSRREGKMAGKLVVLDHVTFIEDDAFPRGIEEKGGRKIYEKKNIPNERLKAATHESYVVMTTRNPSGDPTRLVSSHTSLKRPLWKTQAERAPGRICERISRRHYLTTNKHHYQKN